MAVINILSKVSSTQTINYLCATYFELKLKKMLKRKFGIVVICFIFFCVGCNERTSEPVIPLISRKGNIPKLEIIDSLIINDKVGGFNEYIPLDISPSKKKLILMSSRGGKKVLIGDIKNKNFETLDFGNYEKLDSQAAGIYNVGFVSDSTVAIFYKNELSLINLNSRKLISKTTLPQGVYSSYSKKLTTYITNKDTLFVSQLYSPKQSKYGSLSDGFYDLCPLSIYSIKKNQFLPIYLPKSSKFKTKNLGQPIVNFTSVKDTIFFSTSPDNKLYSFILDTKNFKTKNFKTYEFNYSTGDTLLSLERSNRMKDIYRLAAKNPYHSNLVNFNGNILLSFTTGLNEEQYLKVFSHKLTADQRAEFYANKRKSFTEILEKDQKIDYGHIKLNENIESIALKLSDSTFFLKPKTAYYFHKNQIPIYIAKLKI